MKRLVLTNGVYANICALASAYNLEFAVTLFGTANAEEYVVNYIAPPGRNAEESYARCTADPDFEAAFFEALQKREPEVRWLGDLHAHPPGFSELSGRDMLTIRQILLGADDALHPVEYVAVILLRAEDEVHLYPRFFTKENLKGSEMEVYVGNERLCQKSKSKGSIIRKALGRYWSWKSRQLNRRSGDESRRGENHADRPGHLFE